MEMIARVNSIYDSDIRVETQMLSHEIVEEEMSRNSSFFGPEVLKHLVQNSSLLGNLQSRHLLKVNLNIIVKAVQCSYNRTLGNRSKHWRIT